MISRSISSSSTPLHSQVRAALGLHQGYVLCCEQWSMRKTSVHHRTERKCHRSAQDKRHICITAPWPQGSHKHHRRWGKKTPRARSQGGPEQNSDFCCPRELTYLHRGKPSNIPRSSRQGLRSPHSQPRSYWQVMGAGKGKSVFLRGVAPGKLATFRWMALRPGVHRKHKLTEQLFKKKKENVKLERCGEIETDLRGVRERRSWGECNQNTLHELFKNW